MLVPRSDGRWATLESQLPLAKGTLHSPQALMSLGYAGRRSLGMEYEPAIEAAVGLYRLGADAHCSFANLDKSGAFW